jgi:hypothetical protein
VTTTLCLTGAWVPRRGTAQHLLGKDVTTKEDKVLIRKKDLQLEHDMV